ncbi:wall-associated receptor kinase-like 9 [Salvia miltiorrhiza]|uniref:wall-associated receptor kinase-like 9 n=1 Tax=Salvia miltiorrhiza TaxID=226208 RepID=UPI0025AB8D85|nr:wall-associated receptor kinase-like 9 [Salvia miltiorrhiza]
MGPTNGGDDAFAACSLNFTSFPYKPMGGCTHIDEALGDWNGYPKSSCCQHALAFFAHALALHAAGGAIFIPRSQWNDCSGPLPLQPGVSIRTCGFDDFYYGSSKCSTLHVTRIDGHVVERCSLFGNSSFDDACGSCTSAISDEVENLLADLEAQGSHVEEAVCRVAVVVALMARTPVIGSADLHNCLPALTASEPAENYIKLNDGVAGALFAVILVILGLGVVIKHVAKKSNEEKKMMKKKNKVGLSKELATKCSGLYRFSIEEIEKAMSAEGKLLGRGSAGQVFMGQLPSGQLVAIKKLFQSNTSDSFATEIDGLSRVRHPNLVCLYGCCVEDGQHYLVYEYCPNGNLAEHLLSKECVLTWELRVRILRDCAAALKYLHYHSSGCIVHRDIKLTNILISDEMVAKLSDFGLAKMLGMEESKVFTDVRGTIGYMDPEYIVSAKLTCSSDIYSFGILTLQLLSGQRVFQLDLNARDQLTTKAKDVSAGLRPLWEFQDPRMEDVNTLDMESILQIAVLCTATSSRGRPTIDLVFDEIDRAWRNTQYST